MERPRYRFITGPDDAEFCRRISALLDEGYVLHGSPCLTHDGEKVIAGQAVVWPEERAHDPRFALGGKSLGE